MAGAEIYRRTTEKLFEICSNLINDVPSMKKVYRILTALLGNEKSTDELKEQICQIVRASKGQAKSNAEPMRLNCIHRIILLVLLFIFKNKSRESESVSNGFTDFNIFLDFFSE